MDSEKFNKVLERYTEQLAFGKEMSLDELASRLERLPEMLQNTTGTAFRLMGEMPELNTQKEEMRGELMMDIKLNPNKLTHPRYQVSCRTKEDFDNQFHSYPQWNSLMRKIDVVDAQLKTIQNMREDVTKYGYALKDLIVLKRMQMGFTT